MFAYVQRSPRNFFDTVVAVRKAVESAKWSVLGGYDFSETLASKGFPQASHIRSIDICNASHANLMIQQDERLALCMPCKVTVADRGEEGVFVSALMPGVVLGFLLKDDPGIVACGEQINAEISAIVDAAVQ